jgi:hypothetical protein
MNSATKILDLNSKRLQLLKTGIIQKNNFSTSAFELYKENLRQCLALTTEIIIESFTDIENNLLVSYEDITCGVDYEKITANAFITKRGEDGVRITLNYGLILSIEIMTMVVLTESKNEDEEPPSFEENYFSEEIARILRKNIPENVSQGFYHRVKNFIQNSDSLNDLNWATNFLFSLLWIILHEIGHYLCGHVGFYLDKNYLGLAEKNTEENYVTSELNLHESDSINSLKWCSELMADSYATIRIFWVFRYLINRNEFQNHKFNQKSIFDCIVSGVLIVPIYFNLDNLKKEKEMERLDIGRPYPSEICRIFNVFTTVFNINFPATFTHFGEYTDNPFDDFFPSYFNFRNWIPLCISLVKLFYSFLRFSVILGLKGPKSLQEAYWSKVIFVSSLLASREGNVTSGINMLYGRKVFIDSHLLQWSISYIWLSIDHNLYFAGNLKFGFKGNKGGRNDPVYRALDEWMSWICYRHFNETTPLDETEFERFIESGEYITSEAFPFYKQF